MGFSWLTLAPWSMIYWIAAWPSSEHAWYWMFKDKIGESLSSAIESGSTSAGIIALMAARSLLFTTATCSGVNAPRRNAYSRRLFVHCTCMLVKSPQNRWLLLRITKTVRERRLSHPPPLIPWATVIQTPRRSRSAPAAMFPVTIIIIGSWVLTDKRGWKRWLIYQLQQWSRSNVGWGIVECTPQYRDANKGLYVLLSRTQTEPGRTVKQEQEETCSMLTKEMRPAAQILIPNALSEINFILRILCTKCHVSKVW